MSRYRQPPVSNWDTLACGCRVCNQSGPLSSAEGWFGTLVDRPTISPRKSSTFGMSSRTVADAKRAVREAFRTPVVSTQRTSRQHGGCYPPEPWEGWL